METRKVFIDAQCMSDTQIFNTIIKLRTRNNAYSQKLEEMSPSKVLRFLKIQPKKLTKDTMATIFLAQNTPYSEYQENTTVHDTYFVYPVKLERDTKLVPPFEQVLSTGGQFLPLKDESWESGIRDGIEKRNKFGILSLSVDEVTKVDSLCCAHNFRHLKTTLYNFYKINRKILKAQSPKKQKAIILATLSVFIRVYKLLYERDSRTSDEFLPYWERRNKINPRTLNAYFNREVTVVDILPSKRRRPAIISHARYRENLKQKSKPIASVSPYNPDIQDFLLFSSEF
jgi:hypothetical protein